MKNRNELKLNFAVEIDCYADNSCDEEICQGYFTNLHQITQSEYLDLVQGFFPSFVPPPKPVEAEKLKVDVPCLNNYIKYTANEFNQVDNNEVSVAVMPGQPIEGKYSIALFRGIKKLYAPDIFYFSKAVGFDGKNTLAFYASRNGTPVYFGDLAGLYP